MSEASKVSNENPTVPAPKAPSTKVIHREILNMLDNLPSLVPPMDVRFSRYQPAKGAREVVQWQPLNCREIIPLEELAIALVDHLRHAGLPAHFHLGADEARKLAMTYSYGAKPEAIARVAWADDKGACFTRLPWRYEPADFPTWQAFLARMTNADAFRAFIGSLFFDNAAHHQYCWLHGQGANGKSTISRFLERVFGNAYAVKNPPDRSERFWTHGLLGKRLVVFPDCNDTRFVTTGLFKSLSGGDSVPVEAKYRPSFSAVMDAKYIILSNDRPEISGEEADLRRLILCEFDPNATKIDSEDFEADLWHEGGGFLFDCIQRYSALPRDKPIPVDRERALLRASALEETFENCFFKWFLLSPGGYCLPIDFEQAVSYEFKKRREQQEFRNWLEREHTITKRSLRVDGNVIKMYPGIVRKRQEASTRS